MRLSIAPAIVLIVLFAFILSVRFAPLVAHAADQTSCPSGMHRAAANEVPGVAAGTCTNGQGDNVLYGGCDSNPYPYLEARHVGDRSNSFVTPVAGGQNGTDLKKGINPTLACRLKKFFEVAEQKGCPLKISSAMRPVQRCKQGGGACAPQGASCHQYGLAVDVTGTQQCLNWVLQVLGRNNANSPFGLQSAYDENRGGGKYRHLQCTENLRAACNAQTKGCDGRANINPDISNIPNPQTAPFDQSIRNLISPPPPPPPMQPAAAPQATPIGQTTPQQIPPPLGSANSTPLLAGTCAPQFYCSNSTYYYRTSTCVDQTYQTCQYGCASSGLACATSASQSLSDQLLSSTTANGNTQNSDNGTSTFDLINSYANPVSTSIDIGTSTPIALNTDTQDLASQLQSGAQSLQATSGSGVAVQAQGPASQQTFTSNDLANSPPMFAQQQNTFAIQILDTLRNALLYALQFLRPFGGLPAQSQSME